MNQLVQVVRVLGTPSREDMVAMNRHYTELKFPNIRSQPLARWLSRMTERHIPSNAVDLLSKFFVYNPKQRITAFEALAHPYFDELRDPNTRFGKGVCTCILDSTVSFCMFVQIMHHLSSSTGCPVSWTRRQVTSSKKSEDPAQTRGPIGLPGGTAGRGLPCFSESVFSLFYVCVDISAV